MPNPAKPSPRRATVIQRVRYRFDLALARGPIVVIAWLGGNSLRARGRQERRNIERGPDPRLRHHVPRTLAERRD